MSSTGQGRIGGAQAAALLATGAAAVSFVAGLGTYLFLRFTQHRRRPPAYRAATPAQPSASERRTDR